MYCKTVKIVLFEIFVLGPAVWFALIFVPGFVTDSCLGRFQIVFGAILSFAVTFSTSNNLHTLLVLPLLASVFFCACLTG